MLAAAGVIGFVGNELAAFVRLRAGRRLAAPRSSPTATMRASTGSSRSASIVSAAAVAPGAQVADPIVGLAITLVILKITWDSWRTVRAAEIDLAHIGG